MTQPEQEAREMLAACPCGRAATFLPNDSYGSCQAGCNCEAEPYIARPIGQEAECIAAWNAFAARPTAGIDRATIGKALYEHWADEDFYNNYCDWKELPGKDPWLARADAILKLLPAKTGERGAVIEECARIASEHAHKHQQDLRGFRSSGGSIEVRICASSHWAAGEEIAKAIRALSQPLPDAPIVGEG